MAENAEAAALDAATQAAETARLAAEAAVAASANAAANAEAHAAERTEQLEQKTAEELAAQKDNMSWLKNHTTETRAALESQSSALTQMVERQRQTEAALALIVERLTPPPSPEPEKPAKPESAEADQKAAETAQVQARKKVHRWT